MTNAEMVEYLVKAGVIKTERTRDAFLAVDRAHFTERDLGSSAYYDYPIPTLGGQTISAPTVVAVMLEELKVEEGHKVLEIGSGSGYNTTLLSHLAGESGSVVSVEFIEALHEMAKKNLKKFEKCKNVRLIQGDGSQGYEPKAPYDRIIVTAAMPYLKNHPLVKQLKPDGVLVAPVGSRLYQDIVVYENNQSRKVLPVMFVPLKGKYGFE